LVYEVQIKKRVIKYLSTLRKKDAARIFTAIENLAENPRPSGCKKLTGEEAYRIRIGTFRVLYEIRNDELKVLVINAGARGDIYQAG
jgi:mRNA interferase RelE/StbE